MPMAMQVVRSPTSPKRIKKNVVNGVVPATESEASLHLGYY